MKSQRMDVFAKFVTEDPAPPARVSATRTRRAPNRAGSDGLRPAKPGLKKRPGMPK